MGEISSQGLYDAFGNGISSQASSGQQALDVGVNVSGVQVDPRVIRPLTSSDVVTCNAGTNLNTSALATSANQSTIIGHVDGIEGLLSTGNTNTSNTAASVASIDTDFDVALSTRASAASQTTIIGHVDGIETLIGTTNSTLNTIDGRVDGLEGLVGTTNSTLTTIDGRVDGIEGLLGTSNTNTGTTATNTTTANTLIGAVNETAPASDTASSGLNGRLQRIAQRLSAVEGATGAAAPSNAVQVGGRDFAGNIDALRIPSVDTGNSSSAILTSGSTFTGTWRDVSGFSTASILIFTDQPSATDGLIIEYSTNGTNVDDNDLYTIPASSGQQISIPLVGQYYRIRYTNGGTNQGAFRLQTKLHTGMPKSSSHRVGMPVNGENDAELTLSAPARLSLTANSPASVSVGTTSTTVLAANANRKGVVIQNISTAVVSFGIGATAALNTGITLYPGGVWYMDEFSFSTAQINGDAAIAASTVSVQEFQ